MRDPLHESLHESLHEPLRVLFVCTLPAVGGAASHLVSLATGLAAAGHRVAVVAESGSALWSELERDGRVTLYEGAFTSTFARPAMNALRRAIRDLKPHCVLAVFERDYWGALRASAGYDVPCALLVHHAGLKRINRLLLPLLPRQFLVPSEDLRRWLISLGVSRARTRVLGNPVDTNHFAPNASLRDAARATLGLRRDDVLVGFVGRIETNKGIRPFADALTAAMSRVPSLHALWIGFGRREAELDAVIAASGFASRHIRRPWTDDIRPHYAAMDFLALPSTGRESFGRTLVEAQSCELPVLGSEIGGIPEAMHAPDTGWLVPPGDVSAWADALTAMATDADMRRRMGVAGRAFARASFDSAVIVRAFAGWVATIRS